MKESSKIKDTIRFATSTACVPAGVPVKDVPSSRTFDIRSYKGPGDWVLIFMDKETFESLKKLCEAKGLDVRKVLWGGIMKSKELLSKESE